MDTLALLQQFIKQKKPVYQDAEDQDSICFGNEMKYKKNTDVDFFSNRDSKNLTLGQVWFFLKNCKLVVSKYTSLCIQNNVPAVLPQDKKPLLTKLDLNPDDYTAQEIDDLFSVTGSAAAADSDKKPKEEKSRKIGQISATSKEGTEESEKKRVRISIESDDDIIMFDETVKDAQSKFRDYIEQVTNHTLDTAESHENLDKFIKYDQAQVRKLVGKEIPMSSIASIVKTPKPNANFKEVLDIAKIVREDETIRKKVSEKEKEKTKTKEKEAAQIAVLHPPKEKPDPSAAWKEVANLDEDELQGINPVGSNIAMASNLKAAIADTTSLNPTATTTTTQPASTSSQSTSTKPSHSSSQSHHKIPIIILPPDTSSLLSLYNVKQFLEGCQYMSTDEAKTKTSERPKKLIVRNPLHKSECYLVTDNPERDLGKDDWSRVVAVFTTGKTWQFKNWKGFSQKVSPNDPKKPAIDPTPAEIFAKAKGFHLTFDNLEVNTVVKSWNVHILKISSNNTKRYTDQSIVHSFWKIVSPKK